MSAGQRQTLELVRRGLATAAVIQPHIGITYRNVWKRLQRLEKWGFLSSTLHTHSTGGMERIWRAL